jgi:hypothetical protein
MNDPAIILVIEDEPYARTLPLFLGVSVREA